MSTPGVVAFFTLFVLGLLALDLGVFHRQARLPSLRQAILWSGFWVTLSLTFNLGIYVWRGPRPALEFFTAYMLEKALSLDNIFVFSLILTGFNIPPPRQHKVLFWGVVGALVTRGIFIGAGVALVSRFAWALDVFAAILIVSGMRLLFRRRPRSPAEESRLTRWARKILPVRERCETGRFFLRQDGQRLATPLFLALVLIEATDIMFAVDSIPAVFAVTDDPTIVYTSNILAVLGLRALYFLLAGAVVKFRLLPKGLSLVMLFLGGKMAVDRWYHVSLWASLLLVAGITGGSIAFSLSSQRTSR